MDWTFSSVKEERRRGIGIGFSCSVQKGGKFVSVLRASEFGGLCWPGTGMDGWMMRREECGKGIRRRRDEKGEKPGGEAPLCQTNSFSRDQNWHSKETFKGNLNGDKADILWLILANNFFSLQAQFLSPSLPIPSYLPFRIVWPIGSWLGKRGEMPWGAVGTNNVNYSFAGVLFKLPFPHFVDYVTTSTPPPPLSHSFGQKKFWLLPIQITNTDRLAHTEHFPISKSSMAIISSQIHIFSLFSQFILNFTHPWPFIAFFNHRKA